LPTKGLTLPLMSYGRSSMIVTLAWLGLLLRVYHEALQSGRGMASTRRSDEDSPRASRLAGAT
jgi:cell division protein FtsW